MHMATVTTILVLLYPLLSIPMLLLLPLLFIILFPLICFSLYLFLKYNHQTFPLHYLILEVNQLIKACMLSIPGSCKQTVRPLSCGGQLFGSKRGVGHLPILNILCASF